MTVTATKPEQVADTRVCSCGWLCVRTAGLGDDDTRRWFRCSNRFCARVFHDGRATADAGGQDGSTKR